MGQRDYEALLYSITGANAEDENSDAQREKFSNGFWCESNLALME